MKPIVLSAAILAALLLTAPGQPSAQTAEAVGAASRFDGFDATGALSGADLQTVRAGQDTATINAAISDQTLSADNHDNRIDAGVVNSGAVTISPGALQGFSGLGNFVINTGNNNNLQGSLSVSIFMSPSAR